MAPDVVNWALFGVIVLVAVWVGFLIMALDWILNNALVPLAVFVAAVIVLVSVTEYRRTH